jgi:ketosteroid isomerase-like protein
MDHLAAGRFPALGALFAEDSVWRPPPPLPEVRGGAAIRAGYTALGTAATSVDVAECRYLVDGQTVVVEFTVADADGRRSSVVDVFDCDEDGRVVRMTAYSRGPVTSE